jgi:hypothetical protein
MHKLSVVSMAALLAVGGLCAFLIFVNPINGAVAFQSPAPSSPSPNVPGTQAGGSNSSLLTQPPPSTSGGDDGGFDDG